MASSRGLRRKFEQLIDTLSQTDYDDAGDVIEQFCQSNRASVILNDGITMHTFGTVDEQSVERGEAMTAAIEVKFCGSGWELLSQYYRSCFLPVMS